MKKAGSLFRMLFTGMALLTAVSTVFAADVVVEECSECSGTVVAAGRPHHHRANMTKAAPVYFTNTFPEYTLGSPNIYAGYPDDTVLVAPVRGKTPYHYGYWNHRYNDNPTYGKMWDKNWTAAGENAVYPGGLAWSRYRAKAGYPAYSGKFSYQAAAVNGAYQGGYIANFDDFCTMPCCAEPCPLLNCFRSIFGCCHNPCPAPCLDYCDPVVCCDPCVTDVCCVEPCCEMETCVDSCVDACADNCCDPCAGIGFEMGGTCCGQDAPADMTDSAVDGTVDETMNAVPEETPVNDDSAVSTETAAPAANIPTVNTPIAAPAADAPAAAPTPRVKTPAPAQQAPAAPAEKDDMLLPNPDANTLPAVPGETNVGYIQMTVPEDAVVYINGYQTKMTGKDRRFAAAGLESGTKYRFEIRVEVIRNGQTLTDTQTAVLLSGTTMNVAFNLEPKTDQIAMTR